MRSIPNGRHGSAGDSTRRLRYDLSAVAEHPLARGRQRGMMAPAAPGASGRRFVTLAVVAVLVGWALLYAGFREWRSRYRARAAYGANQVAPAIDDFAAVTPPGLDAGRWRDAVARTHAMLVTVTASNVLGLAEMQDLRAELRRAVARARVNPGGAVAELAGVWDVMSERGEFLIRDTRSLRSDRHPRPGIFPSYAADRVVPGLEPFAGIAPPGVDAGRWREAIDRTRALLLDVTASRRISTMRMMAMRKDLDRAVARARANPASAVPELAAIWDDLVHASPSLFQDPKAVLDRHARPAIFPR